MAALAHQPANILLVDDQPANLQALRAILDQPGLNLVEVRSGEDALRKYGEMEFAVILLDVQMHGLDGLETAKRMRQRSPAQCIPIIFLTAHDENRLAMKEAYALGAVDYLVKPLVPAILRAKVEVFVELFRKTRLIQQQAEQLRTMEAQRAEQELAASEARKDLLLNVAPDAVVTINHLGQVQEFNPAAEVLFGYSRAQVLGQDLAAFLIPARLRARHCQGLVRYLATGESTLLNRRVEMAALARDGREFPIELTVVRIPGSEPPLFTGFIRNISERVRGEQRRAIQLAVSQVLASGSGAAETLTLILEAVALNLKWDVGAIWHFDPEGQLRCIQFWRRESAAVDEFEAETRRRSFALGEGLPGRVLATAQPAWIPDVVQDDNFPRAPMAARGGLHAAFAFPILSEKQTIGVIEFFSQAIQQPDADLLALASTIGVHVGQYLQRRRAEEESQTNQLRFARFMHNLPGLAWIKDRDGRYVFANEAAQLAFNRPADQLLGCTDEQLFPLETARQFRVNDEQAMRSESGIQTVEVLEQADGILHHSLVSKFPIPGARGLPDLIGGMAIDITELKRAEAALRESEARFRQMADNAPVLIWVNNREGCEFVNREYLRFLGCGWEQVRGMNWTRAVHPEDADGYLNGYQQALQQQQPFEAEVRLRRGDGVYRWMRSRGMPRFQEDGTLLGYVGCSLDISDIKNSEAALRDADRRKDEFLATLAHELRNPLAPIRNALHIMRLSSSSANPHVIDMMERQVDHMVRLVDDLLEVSRITRGKIELRMERVDMAAIVRHAVETVMPQIEKRKQRLRVEPGTEPLWLKADAVRLTQVLVNLLNNAAKYTEDGGQIWVAFRAEGDQAIVTLRDTGVGIPADMLPTIFDLFTQVDRHLGRSQGGLGIGLALVKRLVEMHGGTVTARSAGPGQGSEFHLHLPRDQDALVPSAQDGNHLPLPDHKPLRILVADDNRDAAESLGVLLQFMGAEVDVVFGGPAALAAFEQRQPQVAILDLGMPIMDGYELARRIRQSARGEVALIAVSGWGQQEDRRRSQAAGFDHHLVKPVSPEMLERLLASLAQGRVTVGASVSGTEQQPEHARQVE